MESVTLTLPMGTALGIPEQRTRANGALRSLRRIETGGLQRSAQNVSWIIRCQSGVSVNIQKDFSSKDSNVSHVVIMN